MIYVIGSGPAGVAAAHALLARDCSVTMLDVGIEIDASKQKILDHIKKNWDECLLDDLKQTLDIKDPIKLAYNSTYPYADVESFIPIEAENNIRCLPSFAKGGLSNVWGAVVNKYSPQDLADWPISLQQLYPYYEKIYRLLNPAKVYDAENITNNYYMLSEQAKKIFTNLLTHREYLQKANINFGTTELAVQFHQEGKHTCRYCGNCQHGCPLELTYSAKNSLNDLFKHRKFKYINHIVVKDIQENATQVTITAIHYKNRDTHKFIGSQVFCACGPLLSTHLVLKSKKAYNQRLSMKDSTHFVLPCLQKLPERNISAFPTHTFAQLYLNLQTAYSPHPIYLQLYTYMDHFANQLKSRWPHLNLLLKPLTQFFLDRFLIIQGFLHSHDSHQFSLCLQSHTEKLQLMALKNANVDLMIKHVLTILKSKKSYIGFTPIISMLKQSKIAKSFHYGGSIPMKLNPDIFECDIYGRICNSKRWHIVDATIFPSIPAGSITPTIMANAYRIATECPLYD